MTKSEFMELIENIPGSAKLVVTQDTIDGLNRMAVIAIRHTIKTYPAPEEHELLIEIPGEA